MVLYGKPIRIEFMNSLRQIIFLSVGLLEIGKKNSLAAVMVADTSLVVMVSVRFQAGRRRSADGRLRSSYKLSVYIETHH